MQSPAPELEQLRSGSSWTAQRLEVSHQRSAAVQVSHCQDSEQDLLSELQTALPRLCRMRPARSSPL